MIKKTVTYQDFNDKTVTEVLYFNIAKTELMDNLDLREDLEVIQADLEGPVRELDSKEIMRILSLVKRMIKISYGRRSDDGSRFRKSPDVWDDFVSSAVYDAFLMSLFENPEEAFEFIVSVMPKDLIEQAAAMDGQTSTRNVFENNQQENVVELPADKLPTALTETEWTDYNTDQLLNMDQENFDALLARIKGPKPSILLSIGMQRRNKA